MNDRTDRQPDHGDVNDALALLRDANPVTTDPPVRTHPAPEGLFEEIIMTDTQTPLRSVSPDAVDSTGAIRTAPPPHRRWLMPAAVAAAAIVATTTFAVWPNGGQTAEAAVRAAAEATEAAESGTIDVFVDYSDAGEEGTLRFVSRFFGADAETIISLGPENGIEFPDIEYRLVDDRFFSRGLLGEPGDHDQQWFEMDAVDRQGLASELGLSGAFSVGAADGLVALLERADDVERSDDDTYSATITVGAARQLADVPAGLALLTDDTSELDDDQVFDITVRVGDAGRLDSLVIDLVEQDSDTNSSARIEATYRDLDEGDPIEVPVDAQPMPDPMSQIPDELDEPLRIITEFMEANPEVCQDDVEPDDIITCLRSVGADDVADAMEILDEFVEPPQP